MDAGYIYYYDRCEGRYYPDFREEPKSEAAEAYRKSFSRDERAYACYLRAAEAGEPQSCYKVGDMLKAGRGYEADPAGAFKKYERAYELGVRDNEVSWGAAALRLGDCYEQGIGVARDFWQAYTCYERAVAGLSIVVEAGG